VCVCVRARAPISVGSKQPTIGLSARREQYAHGYKNEFSLFLVDCQTSHDMISSYYSTKSAAALMQSAAALMQSAAALMQSAAALMQSAAEVMNSAHYFI